MLCPLLDVNRIKGSTNTNHTSPGVAVDTAHNGTAHNGTAHDSTTSHTTTTPGKIEANKTFGHTHTQERKSTSLFSAHLWSPLADHGLLNQSFTALSPLCLASLTGSTGRWLNIHLQIASEDCRRTLSYNHTPSYPPSDTASHTASFSFHCLLSYLNAHTCMLTSIYRLHHHSPASQWHWDVC